MAEYGPTVLRVCRAVLGPADADDAWSETFLSALRAYPDLPADANVEAWLVTIAHRKAIDVTRAAARRAVPVADPPESEAEAGLPDLDLAAAVAALPPKQRQAVAYHYLAGLPYAEIAEILGGSTDAARRAAADGIAALRRTIRSEPDERRCLRRIPRRGRPTWAGCAARLAAAAEAEGILDVAYRTVDTPVGPLLLAATEQGLVRVAYPNQGHDAVLQALADRVSPRVLHAPARLDPVARQLDEYFAGRRRQFDLPLDWRLSTGFRSTVLHHLATDVGYGRTASYAARGRAGRQPEGGPRGGHRLRDQPAAGRRALPPGGALGRRDRRLRRRRRGQAHPAAAGGGMSERAGMSYDDRVRGGRLDPGRDRAGRARLRA